MPFTLTKAEAEALVKSNAAAQPMPANFQFSVVVERCVGFEVGFAVKVMTWQTKHIKAHGSGTFVNQIGINEFMTAALNGSLAPKKGIDWSGVESFVSSLTFRS